MPSNGFAKGNGSVVKKAVSNNSLYTHTETSRETSPAISPHVEYEHLNHYPAFSQNNSAFQENARLHKYSHSHPVAPMKSRPRGESDLGKPANAASQAYKPVLESIPATSSSWFSLPEALTSLLIPLPCLLASATYASMSGLATASSTPLSAYAEALRLESESTIVKKPSGLIEACVYTSGTLLLLGGLAKAQSPERTLDKRKDLSTVLTVSGVQAMLLRSLSIGLPFYASVQLGGMRTGLILIVGIAVNMTCSDVAQKPFANDWKQFWASKRATSAAIFLSFITDVAGLTGQRSLTQVSSGYLALILSLLVLQSPLSSPTSAGESRESEKISVTTQGVATWIARAFAICPLTRSPTDLNVTLAAGAVLAVVAALATLLSAASLSLSGSTAILTLLTSFAMTSAILFSQPSSLRSQSKAGLGIGCLVAASFSFLSAPSFWPGTIFNSIVSALFLLAVLHDTRGALPHTRTHDDHDHAHNDHSHHGHSHSKEGGPSALTKFLMSKCKPGSLVFSILSEKDSRRIAYFTVLNFAFMIVQGAYGYLSGSLGLLSDTVHMFFDCLGLVVGLGAAVASKWPTSPEKPYGWGKLNTLAGFGNGIFLMLVSIEFVWEAIEGIVERTELRHVKELLVVSTLGLLVNMVGLFAFGHAHAGHDHGRSHGHPHAEHDHGHSHSHSNGHDDRNHHHGHAHANGHAHSDKCDHDHDHKAHAPVKPVHDHHHNENMHGIFLHVAADAGGSLAVIISTALTLWKPWYFWDPLATIIIAVLIFAAAVPLVTSSGQKLLLVINGELEYNIKDALQELSEMSGVVGYAVPRFWIDDKEDAGDAHGHNHGHDHGSHSGPQKVRGVIHVIASPSADLDDVQRRVEEFATERNMNLVIHVERETDGQCWCGGIGPKSG